MDVHLPLIVGWAMDTRAACAIASASVDDADYVTRPSKRSNFLTPCRAR